MSDERFATVDVRFLGTDDSRCLALENRLTVLRATSESGFDGVMKQFDALQKKMDSQFRWLVGIQFGVLVTIIGVLLSR